MMMMIFTIPSPWVHTYTPFIRDPIEGHNWFFQISMQPMRVSEEPVCIHLFRQNPIFTFLHLRSPVYMSLRLCSQIYLYMYFYCTQCVMGAGGVGGWGSWRSIPRHSLSDQTDSVMEPKHKRQPILRKEPGKGWALKNCAMLQIPLAGMEEAKAMSSL